MNKILALIPARGGSKGIPRKNILPMAGKPLIAWTISAAQESSVAMRIVCSTDSPEIAAVAKEYGAEVPWLRPDSLATDEASSLDVALHAIDSLDEEFSHLFLLQPTSPLRIGKDLDDAVDLMERRSATAVIGVASAPSHPFLTYRLDSDGEMYPYCPTEGQSVRRQDLPLAVVVNGAIYLNQIAELRRSSTFFPKSVVGFEMPQNRSIDIDDWDDWKTAETRLKELRR